MVGVYSFFFICFLCIFNDAVAQNYYDWYNNILRYRGATIKPRIQDLYFLEIKNNELSESVDLKLYYESLCPGCIQLDRTEFKKVVNVLGQNLDIKTYPYGNARTMETDGKIEFVCQHGPKECYGNKLHACSLKLITNHTQALLFNICMMEPNGQSKGSDDDAAKKCANQMNVNKGDILKCAKGEEGIQLLKYYGEESDKANFNYVPYVLINGKEWQGDDLMKDVCAEFQNPPRVCYQ